MTILALQALLAGRLKPVCEQYGLDMVLRFHKSMAVLSLVLLVAHPVLLSLSAGSWNLITSLDLPWYIIFGKIALLLVIQGITSIWQRRLLDFQTWRVLHNVAPGILVLVFVHSWMAGGDLQATPMRVLWVALFAIAVVAYSAHKFVGPISRKSNLWTVKSVSQETHDVYTLEFEPPEGSQPLQYNPGQFQFLTLYRDDRYDGEEHHFTISSSPSSGPTHTSTIKNSGDFTATIGETEPGDRAMIQAPFGRFSYAINAPDDRYLFIAGGIGITPLMAMLRHMRDEGADCEVTLLFGNKTEDDIVFRDELHAIAVGETPNLSVVHVLSQGQWEGETGYIDRDLISRYVGDDLSGMSIYLCGPEAMMDTLIPELLDINANQNRLYSERFWL
ncbi:MAG: ferredoxin reductase family protein [Armatimonadota bacterium]|nr:ferredoxin reductase family protein [Armatimonadota bacterium]